jgi:hypothetical protein
VDGSSMEMMTSVESMSWGKRGRTETRACRE